MSKILIIDDRALNRQFLSTLLGYQQHRLLETRDGAEGLRVTRELSESKARLAGIINSAMDSII